MVEQWSSKLIGAFTVAALFAAVPGAMAQNDGGTDTDTNGAADATNDTAVSDTDSAPDTAGQDTGEVGDTAGDLDAGDTQGDDVAVDDTGTPPEDTGQPEDTGAPPEDTSTPDPGDTAGAEAGDAEPTDIGPLDSEVTCACGTTGRSPLPGSFLVMLIACGAVGLGRRRGDR